MKVQVIDGQTIVTIENPKGVNLHGLTPFLQSMKTNDEIAVVEPSKPITRRKRGRPSGAKNRSKK